MVAVIVPQFLPELCVCIIYLVVCRARLKQACLRPQFKFLAGGQFSRERGHGHLLSHPPQFIINQSSFYMILYSLKY